MKYLIWLIVLAGAALWWNAGRRRAARRPPAAPPAPAPAATALPQAMGRCAHCGLHLPLADAVQRDDRVYCSASHADAGVPGGGA